METYPRLIFLTRVSKEKHMRYIDILINCPTTVIKRVANSSRHEETRRLKDYIKKVDKKYWCLSEPKGKQNWSFICGTNWDSFPQLKSKGFVRLESKKGQEIFNMLQYTSKERGRK